MSLVRVAVPIPTDETYVYEFPDEEPFLPGLRVRVPLGTRRVWGTLLEPATRAPSGVQVRPIAGIPEPRLKLSAEVMDLCRWVAEYYSASLGEALHAAVPTPTGLTRGAARAPAEDVEPWAAGAPPERARLNAEQLVALESVEAALRARVFQAFLLFGVTGSGKTAVYLHAAREAIRLGGQALVLVPEIALAPQALDAARRAGLPKAALYHSTLLARERIDVWRAAQDGALDVVVGTRSAVFLPFRDLRLVVVDEEQEGAYKQEEAPRYHARDVALVRAQRLGATAVLASATPSLESYARARRGTYQLLRLKERVDGRPLATVRVTDLRRRAAGTAGAAGGEGGGPSRSAILSSTLALAMAGALERREQGILFLNRRGHSTYLQCRACGHVERCDRCDVSLTVHLDDSALRCHYCGASRRLKSTCPSCGAAEIWFGGVGLQRVEREVRRLFPTARVARLDLDAARRRGSAAAILRGFREGETDFLLGTQMVAKGFDFPGVTLVGIVVADLQLYLPDFRAAERTFQLLTQVAGRAGRGAQAGEVIMQSYDPDHPALRAAAAQDFEAFFEREAAERRELHYPPFGHLVEIELRGAKRERVEEAGARVRGALERAGGTLGGPGRPMGAGDVEILGPTPKPLARLKGSERWHLLLRSTSRRALHELLARAMSETRRLKLPGVRIGVDVDPRQVL